jgi:RHS repeat-associated protein
MRPSATLSITRLRFLRLAVGLCVCHCTAAAAFAQAQDTVVYYHTDAIGSVRMITDANGQVISRYEYLPFGEPWLPPVAADIRQFAGKERDAETGLDYFGARYYASGIGRFTTADSWIASLDAAMMEPQLWNRYAYVSNNPLRKVDPDGRWERDVHYELTRVLAEAAGFGTGEAAHIAHANQFTDENPETSPMGMRPFGEAVERRARWHFTGGARRQELWTQFKSTGSLDDLGIFLHAEQDSFSHVGFSARFGQVPSFVVNGTDLKAVDKTAHKPERADAMARDTYAWLVKASGSRIRVQWSILEPYVRRFNRALPSEKERILEELDRQLGDQ